MAPEKSEKLKRTFPRRFTWSLLIVLSLLACVPAFAAKFEKKSEALVDGSVRNFVWVKSDAPIVEIVILDEFGQKVESATVRLPADRVDRYYVKYEGVFDVQVRDLTEKELRELWELGWKRTEEAIGRKVDQHPEVRSIGELVGGLFGAVFTVALTIAFLAALGAISEKRSKSVSKAVRRIIGLRPLTESELSSVSSRVHAILQPPVWGIEEQKKIGPVYSLRIGRHDAFLYEWVYYSPTTEGWTTIEQHAYIVLGSAAPYMRVSAKAIFGEPANTVDFPEDRAFSHAFWVEGTDKAAVRRYLGPELRQFLLAHLDKWQRGWRRREWGEKMTEPSPDTSWSMNTWRFHAGPEGVALVLGGRTPLVEAHRVTAILEDLAKATEDAARQAR